VLGVQHPNFALRLSSLPLQHGAQWVGSGPGLQLVQLLPLVSQVDGSQHPAPQPRLPGGFPFGTPMLVQFAAHCEGAPVCPQMLPALLEAKMLALHAHPQPPVMAVTWQQLPLVIDVPHWFPVQWEEQCPLAPFGHVTIEQLFIEPPTLQLVASQQQQQPATAAAPLPTLQSSVEKSAHCWFVGVAAAAMDGTAIE
jgi:hypothetical protein